MDALLYGKAALFKFQGDYSKFSGVRIFMIFVVIIILLLLWLLVVQMSWTGLVVYYIWHSGLHDQFLKFL